MLDAPPTLDKTMVVPKWGVEFTENLTGSPKGIFHQLHCRMTIDLYYEHIGPYTNTTERSTSLHQISLQDLQYHPRKVSGLDPQGC